MFRNFNQRRGRILVFLFLALALFLISLHVWSALATQAIVDRVEREVTELKPRPDTLTLEKSRQDLIDSRIKNAREGALQDLLATGVDAVAAALVAIAGALLAFFGYLDTREKERRDRLGTALNETLTRLAAGEARQRAVGAAGLLPFFEKDCADYHLQALSALVAASRLADDEEGARQVRLVVEQALSQVPHDVLARISWRGVRLAQINLAGRDLRGLDFRDADLQDAVFTDARLDGADLCNAKLQGARLDGAGLSGVKLNFADLAGASLAGSLMSGAQMNNVKVLNLDLGATDFTAIGSGWRAVPWEATLNWRRARFDPAVRTELEATYGPEAPALRVLMLMWEAPPFVAGGTWTACYHLVRNLRRRGANVTVVVPWQRDAIIQNPFDLEVPIVALGMIPPAAENSGSGPAWSPYASQWSSYGRQGVIYPGIYPHHSPYSGTAEATDFSGSILFRLIAEFSRRLEAYARDNGFDLVHAHDWVTFEAARAAAALRRVPWIAHFHSLACDRQPDATDPLVARLERDAVDSATLVVAPSDHTRTRIMHVYGTGRQAIAVVPNTLSDGAPPAADMGRFETRRIVFLGRMTAQKGVDRFCRLAQQMRKTESAAHFEAFGDGEQRDLLAEYGVTWNGALAWSDRGRAFRGTTAIVVPSRSEPFGMVILEAMQHRVPVLYPSDSGAAEVLKSGFKIGEGDYASLASEKIATLLSSLAEWERAVREQAAEIEDYPRRDYPDRMTAVWRLAVVRPAEA